VGNKQKYSETAKKSATFVETCEVKVLGKFGG